MNDKGMQLANAAKREGAYAAQTERRGRQLAKFFRLMALARSAQYNAAQLAQQLAVSQRTVHRMLAALRIAGVHIEYSAKLNAYVLSAIAYRDSVGGAA